jgi:hypothetical protein
MPSLTWTQTKPSVPGWYWWRGNYYAPEVVCVYLLNGPDTDQLAIDEVEIDRHEGEWAGPIEPPEEG